MKTRDDYAHVKLSDEQMEELSDKFFDECTYAIDGQVLMVDGHIDIITILLAADHIKGLFEKDSSVIGQKN